MSFTEDLTLFLDQDEHAEAITWNASNPLAIVEDHVEDSEEMDVMVQRKTLRLAKTAIPPAVQGEEITYNGDLWRIDFIYEEQGMLIIQIFRLGE